MSRCPTCNQRLPHLSSAKAAKMARKRWGRKPSPRKISAAIAAHPTKAEAAASLGVTPETLSRWLKDSRQNPA